MTQKNFPQHIGIIMDGNRRYARSKGMDPWKGHEEGEKKFEELLKWCEEFNLKELTLYTFSVQNFKRPKKEFDFLMNLLKNGAKKIIDDEKFNDKGVKIMFLGRLYLFDDELQKLMNQVMNKTKDNKLHMLNFAMGYGGREEITDAVKKIAENVKNNELKPEEITEETINKNLYLKSEPELIIRTSGEKRTSNFLPWQSVYSEWCFVDKYWPEFTKEDFIACLEDYSKRERRIGK